MDWPAHCSYLEGQLMMAEGNFREASQRFKGVRSQLSPELQSQADQYLMKCYNALGRYDETSEIAATGASKSLEAKISEAKALVSTGKAKEALAIYEQVKTELERAGNSAFIPQINVETLPCLIAIQMEKAKEDRDWSNVDAQFALLRQQGVIKEPAASLYEANLHLIKG